MNFQQYKKLYFTDINPSGAKMACVDNCNRIKFRKQMLSNIMENLEIERDASRNLKQLLNLQAQYQQCVVWMLNLNEEMSKIQMLNTQSNEQNY